MTVTASQLALYVGALLVLFLTPGPVWLALTARTLAHGFTAAFPLMLGVAIGDVLWSVVALLGLAWIVDQYAWVTEAMKWAAVVVFAVMGGLLIRNAGKPIAADSRLTRKGAWAGFAAGLIAILANPKAILFYLGLLPGFFDLSRITAPDVAVIAAASMAVPLVGNSMFAAFVDRARRLLSSPTALRRVTVVAGWLLIGVAALIGLS
ncbi:LysE family transporter [Rhodobacterales bacterium HKCCE2091]|nr:LysE family transporter [Rhodobacterales bacterium HKCCE2091]